MGYKHTPEHREKIRLARIGKTYHKSERQRQKEGNVGQIEKLPGIIGNVLVK